MGGGPAPTKTYSLTVTVLSAANDSPLAGASVEVAGNKTESKVTDADGKVTFSGLKGTVEVLVEMVGFAGKNEKLELNNCLLYTSGRAHCRQIPERSAGPAYGEGAGSPGDDPLRQVQP